MSLAEGRRIVVSRTDFFRVLDSVFVSKIAIPNKDQNGFKRFSRYTFRFRNFSSSGKIFYEVVFKTPVPGQVPF